jgi:hypothetical protein
MGFHDASLNRVIEAAGISKGSRPSLRTTGATRLTTNFADGAVSRYAVNADGNLSLEDATAGIAVDGETGLRDEDLSSDCRFLYVLNADSRHIFGWAVSADGTLSPVGAWGAWDELPVSAAGLAASRAVRLQPLYRATFTTSPSSSGSH